jgi:hypothetical protein
MWKAISRKDAQSLDQILSSVKKKKSLLQLLLSRNELGNTPILEALSGRPSPGGDKIILLLLSYSGGIGLNAQDAESGYTALHKVRERKKLCHIYIYILLYHDSHSSVFSKGNSPLPCSSSPIQM